MKLYWFNKLCCVPGCYNTSSEGEGCFKEYFDLPAEPQARRRWLNAILTEDGENLKICEDHFKDDDIFRDKNNRKKLRLNSVPSVKLPQHICPKCLGSKKQSDGTFNYELKVCHCHSVPVGFKSIQQISPTTKRTRITWKVEEKKTLFRAVKKYGVLKSGNRKIRIHWNSVVNYCRSNGCFGNEKELKSVWQNIRTNAARVYRNEIFGSKLERKVSRFLYGKVPNSSRSRPVGERRSSNNSSNQSMNVDSTDEDEYRERARSMMQEFQEEDMDNSAIVEEKDVKNKQVEKVEQSEAAEEDDESDEYYSISDIEEIFQIKIRPRPPDASAKVISLLSSDDEDS